MKEKWHHFRKGYYEVSNFGRVRRAKPGINTWKGRLLKFDCDSKGYPHVTTFVKNVKKRHAIHVLVARKFIGPIPSGMEVNHKDLNKGNPRFDNLEYLTPEQNMQHARANGVKFGRKRKRKEV